jgi:hypothetical protein
VTMYTKLLRGHGGSPGLLEIATQGLSAESTTGGTRARATGQRWWFLQTT